VPKFKAAPTAITAPKCVAATGCFGPILSIAPTAIHEALQRLI
jgi:hypothetical protein